MTRSTRVVVSASIAYDYIMHFDGSFADHILQDKAHTLSVSFLLDSFKRQHGGVAGNMVYNLSLLGVPTSLVGTVGQDFGSYRAKLENLGVDLSHVIQDDDDFTATAFMNADNVGNQIASFYPGSSADAQKIDVTDIASTAAYGIVSAGDPGAMVKHTEEIAAADGCELIFDPAFQIVILSPEQIARGIELADIVIGNDYEFGMMTNKTGLSVDDIAARRPMTVITYGSRGSEIRANGESHLIPIAPTKQFGDPTGGGDAYRAGLIAGLLIGADLPVAGRMAALTSTHAIEYHGAQEHIFTPEGFVKRFDESFPDYAGAVSVEALAGLAAQ
ncbi:MAG: carbohydrate kinase family protein [Thermomicrobiales bacterium]|nr:carbohydrate kinase family protein [Thermomicrobiales bacterium]